MSASRPSRFTPGVPRYPLTTRLIGPQKQSGRGGEEKKFFHCQELNPSRLARSIVIKLNEFILNWINTSVEILTQIQSLKKKKKKKKKKKNIPAKYELLISSSLTPFCLK
jgi:hypothetical protein